MSLPPALKTVRLPRSKRLRAARERLFVAAKWLRSFFRRHWDLRDYPLLVRPNGPAAPESAKWICQILRWSGPCGLGPTIESARAALSEDFERIRMHRRATHRPLPRPGTKVPLQLAVATRMAVHPELRAHFIREVLRIPRGHSVFLSDETSLEHFSRIASAGELASRVREAYGVDVSDLCPGLICEILERIASQRESDALAALNTAEYLILRSISGPNERVLRLVVEEAVTAPRAPGPRPSSLPENLGGIFGDARPIVSDASCCSYEVSWPSYAAYAVTLENEARAPPRESYEGRLFRRYKHSDFAVFIGKTILDCSSHLGQVTHWEVVTLNQIVDVAARQAPEVRKFKRSGHFQG
ncbi:MAG TPA: hypothetical protein VHC86_13210 [Opitutaceae bacterium]|nr:hypothetical protein [Opitutaceae bacterium]